MTAQYPDAEARRRTVLVAVINNAADLHRAAAGGWYRIPQRKAPERIGADYLAFYQTGAFGVQEEAQTVTYFAPTRRYLLMTRRELLPEEVDHARANDYYYRVDLGPLQRLERPVPAGSFKRITFIHTTLARLLMAGDVKELFPPADPFDHLWQALRAGRLRPLKNRLVGDRPIDIALRARGGYLGIDCSDDSLTREATPAWPTERWELLHFSPERITLDLAGCLRQIGAALLALGGTV
jgi:hypothetical protein